MEPVKKHSGVFYFDPEDKIYMDHFPGNPVVPGTVIIHSFLQALLKVWKFSRPAAVKNFRFKRFVSPGEYRYEMEMRENTIRCRVFDGKKVVVTGELVK